ncbi:MAG: type 1 glutamine amidotransferase domain-containing protein [Candidatus Promineifilaceae bacterium]|nr:type 1 glutamine amidotransferase domain-containing protein [Candidatus Promineifilaceae bacterium]
MKQTETAKRVAILVEDGFEEEELTRPQQALQESGAKTDVVSPRGGTVRSWVHGRWGEEFDVDVPLAEADPDDYDAVLLPGGVLNPDKLRRVPDALHFVRRMADEGKLVAAICHGPWTLIDAGVVRDRRVTSYHSLQTDLKNAGADWIDKEVVIDGNLVTSRNPGDIPAFNREMIARLQVTE